jgi:signal transduction histidine kinase
MGLAICKKIIERHGGSVTAKSMPGEGSTFIIDFPMGGVKSEQGF